MISEKAYNNLDVTISEALKSRHEVILVVVVLVVVVVVVVVVVITICY